MIGAPRARYGTPSAYSFPTRTARYHDILLHDGDARGERLLRGEKVPVFNELAILQPSAYATFQVEIRVPRFDDDLAELPKLLLPRELAVEDWTANVRQLCEASVGTARLPSLHCAGDELQHFAQSQSVVPNPRSER